VLLQVHYGAGAYICGEETALIESLEGKQVRAAASAATSEGLTMRSICGTAAAAAAAKGNPAAGRHQVDMTLIPRLRHLDRQLQQQQRLLLRL
jgi:hypothetical protein